MSQVPVVPVPVDRFSTFLPSMTWLLKACVDDGASVGFVQPFSQKQAEAFWTDTVLPRLVNGLRQLFVASLGDEAAGAVQLDCDMPPNQRHRAEVSKLLVHPTRRREGVGRALMERLEIEARHQHKSLVTLDTRTGDNAQRLCLSLGFKAAGVIPAYARDPLSARLDATTYMYKAL